MRKQDRLLLLGDSLVFAGYFYEQFNHPSAPLFFVALGHAVLLAAHFFRRVR